MLHSHVTVPVIIDSVKMIDDFQMSRCVYFRAGWDDSPPFAAWSGVRGGMLPMWDQGALLVKPRRGDRFRTVAAIHRLFSWCEENGMLLTQGHVWVPNRLLARSADRIQRGNVYRLPYVLFQRCKQMASGRNAQDRMLFEWEGDGPEFSPDETDAFAAWGEEQIHVARRRYHSPQSDGWRLARKGNQA